MAKEQTPHWDTPYGTAKPGSAGKKLVGLLVVGLAVVSILGGLIAWSMNRKDPETAKKDKTIAELEAGEQPVVKTVSDTERAKSAELGRLADVRTQLKGKVSKYETNITKFTGDLNSLKSKARGLAKTKPRTNVIKHKLKGLIAEAKEVKRLLALLVSRKEKLEIQVSDIESTQRRVRRQLEASDLLDDDEKKKVLKLLATSEVMIKDSDSDSLDSQLSKEPADTSKEAEVNEGELDSLLGDD